MRRPAVLALALSAPAPALAHDAFGDLGPFYASLLHPLADPMQAALVIGTAAFLAGRSLGTVRVALPVFAAAAALSHLILGWRLGVLPSPLLAAVAAVAVGSAATLPDRWTRVPAGLILVAATGILVGLAPDRPPAQGALQPILGTVLGVAILATIAWAALDAAARRLSPLAPAVAGSWVAAVGLLAGAFAFQSGEVGATTATAILDPSIPERSDR
jgi:hydrogenase/urease accessory protein HupE